MKIQGLLSSGSTFAFFLLPSSFCLQFPAAFAPVFAFTPSPSGKIQILSYTTCLIDEVKLSGRVSAAWLKQHTDGGTQPAGETPHK